MTDTVNAPEPPPGTPSLPEPPQLPRRKSEPASTAGAAPWLRWLAPLALVALVALAYWPAFGNGFIWDDDAYVVNSRVIHDGNGLRRIWFEPGATPQYYPLVHTTFWLEHKLWGMAPQGYHAVNVALHALAAVLLWFVLRRLRVPAAWLAAALFAVHPVNVESAGWITERKNVLSLVFYLGSLLASCRFLGLTAGEAAAARARPWRHYLVAFALYLLALLSKTVTASLPAALLVLLWWRRPHFGRRELAQAALFLPFMAVGAVLSSLTAWMERNVVGAVGAAWAHTAIERLLIAGRALWFYLGKLLWPHPLAFFYQHWTIDSGQPGPYLWPLAFVALTAALFLLRGRLGKGPLVALLLFAGTLVPALGFFDVFPHQYSFVADHFQYAASIPMLTLAAAGGSLAYARLRVAVVPLDGTRIAPRAGMLRVGLPAAVLALLVALSVQRNLAFENLLTLWQDTVAKTPGSLIAHGNLGQVLLDLGRYDEAVPHLEQALRSNPNPAYPHLNLGLVRERQGRLPEAEREIRAALSSNPNSANVLINSGSFFARRGRYQVALGLYRRASAAQPWNAAPYLGVGQVLAQMGDRDGAERFYRRVLELEPDNHVASAGLAELSQAAQPAAAPKPEGLQGQRSRLHQDR